MNKNIRAKAETQRKSGAWHLGDVRQGNVRSLLSGPRESYREEQTNPDRMGRIQRPRRSGMDVYSLRD